VIKTALARQTRFPEPFVHKFLIILACVPVTPIALGVIAIYRRANQWRKEREQLPPCYLPVID
jgi:hypothetical protein